MTSSQQFIKAYSDFLSTHCQCYADSEGNRPCDYGCLCDRCMTKEAQEVWARIRQTLK